MAIPSTDDDETGSTDPADGLGLDILVVDDDPRNLLAIEAALGDLAGRLVKARSGSEALRLLLDRDFALILLDVQMPGLDGFETARLVRERGKNRHIPIIFVTAYERDDREVMRGYSLGAVDFLFKPIIPEVLRAKATVFVELQRRTDEVRRQADRLRELERQNFEQRLEQERERWRNEALQRQMEEQRRINRELEAADRQKNDFLAMLGHELRNPLAPVLISLELMRMQGLENPSLEKARAAAERQVRHLTRLVDDLLDISRIERGKIELQRSRHDLRDIVSQAVETAQPFAEEKGHELVTEVPEGASMWTYGDSVRLVQVVGNLLHNSIRYTDEGGHVRVALRSDDGRAHLSVDDDGHGIEPELLDKVFDVFVQARRSGQGLGLGLTLVKRLVEMHEGAVEAFSEGPGQGSRFDVWLPLCAGPEEARHEPAEDGATEAMRVVVVDDDEDIRESMQWLLECIGHQVMVASDGETGLEVVLGEHPDVALLDLGLPSIDGLEMARRIRARLGTAAPYLVAVSGYGQDSDRRRAREAGFDDHLVKPASVDDLRAAIARGKRASLLPQS